MNNPIGHTFHIPVMGLGFTIDTPIKVAQYGISSSVSIIQDKLCEQMREFYSKEAGVNFTAIPDNDIDHRAKRITSYLNLMQQIVSKQIQKIKNEPFGEGRNIENYFKFLPNSSSLKDLYRKMIQLTGEAKDKAQEKLKANIIAGAIDVNIMTKLDNVNYTKEDEPLPLEYCDAMAALRGFAKSSLSSSVVFSAGLNPRLFAYVEQFSDFFPNKEGFIKKKIILKVSDYRSALIQGKYFAKKGLWISEFRIESGLNCGGHAFPTNGRLLGPILEEFKELKRGMISELYEICNKALKEKEKDTFMSKPEIIVTAQGGIGTAKEDTFLREYYNIERTGWGSPFLLVPEATNVDKETLDQLVSAKKEDYYLSNASPLGVPFNNFKKSSSERQRLQRIEKNRPGSPCYSGYLAFNTEFTDKPICSASRQYQNLKLKELEASGLSGKELQIASNEITEKDCLCEGLTSTALLNNNIPVAHNNDAVTICPGPNLAYFSSIFSLEEMIGHIYGRKGILNVLNRPHVFVKELTMYFDYLKDEIQKSIAPLSKKQIKYFSSFSVNLLEGIEYYKDLAPKLLGETEEAKVKLKTEFDKIKERVSNYFSSEKENWALKMGLKHTLLS